MAEKQRITPVPSDGDRPAKKVKFSPQVSISEFLAIPAKDAVTFHVLYGSTAAELETEIQAGGAPFTCEFYNQVFGDGEEINGYKGLEVHIWIALRSGHCWVNISHQESKPGADDVKALLAEWWPKPFTTNKAEFLQAAAAAADPDFTTLGVQLSSSIATGVGVPEGVLQLYHAKLAETPDWFKELHARLEPLLIFTIDGANFTDVSDTKWEVVAAVVKHNGRSYLAGFMTLYNFYAWPLSHRPRVAQVLVLPTLQGCGYGRALVAAAYQLARDRDAIDLTFEDPAPGLQSLREKLELEMMAACDWLTEPAAAALAAAAAEERKMQEAAKKLWEAGGKQQQQAQVQEAAGGPEQGSAAAAGEEAAGSSGADGGSGNGGSSIGNAGSSHLVMPLALQQRVTKELKIHKHQVFVVWEALLFLESKLAEQYGTVHQAAEAELLLEPLTELVTTRLESGAAAATDKAAANKKMVQVEGTEEDWFVYKLPRQLQTPPEDEELADTISVGRHNITKVSADDYSERLHDQVSQRMDALAVLKRRIILKHKPPVSAAGTALM